MATPVLTPQQYLGALSRARRPYQAGYLAMYSSQWDGIVTDPALWTVPADDHAVHRGDAAFAVFKCVAGRAYCLGEHLGKVAATARLLGIKAPPEFGRAREILADTVRAGGRRDALVRLTLTRGPGGFTSNPYECPVGLFLVTVSGLPVYSEEDYARGKTVVSAALPARTAPLATIKSTSYLHNVLVKKAALDAGADYGVCFTADGRMTESSTENVSLVTADGHFVAPEWDTIFQGVALTHLMALAQGLVAEGLLAGAGNRPISRADVAAAREAFISSTTTDVLPITTWDGRPVGTGRQGPIGAELLRRLRLEYTEAASPWVTEPWL